MEPSPKGFRRIAIQFQESIERHEAEIATLRELQARLPELDFTGRPLSEHERDLLDEAFGLAINSRDESIAVLRQSIADIDRHLAHVMRRGE